MLLPRFIMNAETLKKCGDLWLDIELNYYAPEKQTQNKVGSSIIEGD